MINLNKFKTVMCYWVGSRKVREALYKHFQENPDDEIAQLYYQTFMASAVPPPVDYQEHWVAIGKSHPQLTAITRENGIYRFRNLTWGLEWSYLNPSTGKEYSRELLNSTCEKVFWQHRDLIYSRRCVVPVDGYFEFYHFRGNTYPHFLYPKDRTLFYLGGIWDSGVDHQTGEVKETLSIITTPPNDITRILHNNPEAPNGSRMLLIIEPDKVAEFLDERLSQKGVASFFRPFPSEEMAYHPVIRFLKREFSHLVNTPKVQEAFVYPELVA